MGKPMEELLDLMYTTREEMRDLEKQKTEKQKIYDEAEYELVQSMQENDLRSVGSKYCTATLKEEKYPKVEDLDAFVNWCASNGYANMMQKRINKAAFDEYFNQYAEYPEGVDTYDKLTLGLRKR